MTKLQSFALGAVMFALVVRNVEDRARIRVLEKHLHNSRLDKKIGNRALNKALDELHANHIHAPAQQIVEDLRFDLITHEYRK